MFPSPENSRHARVLATALLAIAATTSLPTTLAHASIADSWSWPVEPPWRIERSYVAPPTPYGVGHRGIDLAAPQETAIRAPAPGVVLFAGIVVDRGVISIDHGNGVISSYEPVSASVVAGDHVQAGDVVGVISGFHTSAAGAESEAEPESVSVSVPESGFCSCLHMGTRLNGEYLSPLAFLSAIDRAVLLPWRD